MENGKIGGVSNLKGDAENARQENAANDIWKTMYYLCFLQSTECSSHRVLFVATVATVKAKFHYASWFGASSELASVMEFGF